MLVNTFGLWICIDQLTNLCLESISQKRKMLVTEKFIRSLVEKYGKHAVFTNGGTWYPEACNFLQVKRIAYHLEKKFDGTSHSIFKDRIESIDDYYSPFYQ